MKPIELLADIDNENNAVIAVLGMLGHGKTLSAVALAVLLKLINKELGNELTILSNTPLKIDYELLTSMNQLEDIYDTIVVFDEIYGSADSYNPRSTSSFMTTDVSQDLRKRNNTLILTSQYANQIAKRVRQLITLFIKPQEQGNFWYRLNVANVSYGADMDSCLMNLKPFIYLYDTRYKPISLVLDEPEKKKREDE